MTAQLNREGEMSVTVLCQLCRAEADLTYCAGFMTCARCRIQLEPKVWPKPWRDPCIFGGAIVGSEKVPEVDMPVDPLADVKAAWKAGKRIRFVNDGRPDYHPWRSIKDSTCFDWTLPRKDYELQPDPVPAVEDAPQQLPLNRKLRQYASALSYNDKAPIPAVKHLLLEAAMKIDALERTTVLHSTTPWLENGTPWVNTLPLGEYVREIGEGGIRVQLVRLP